MHVPIRYAHSFRIPLPFTGKRTRKVKNVLAKSGIMCTETVPRAPAKRFLTIADGTTSIAKFEEAHDMYALCARKKVLLLAAWLMRVV